MIRNGRELHKTSECRVPSRGAGFARFAFDVSWAIAVGFLWRRVVGVLAFALAVSDAAAVCVT